MYSPQIYSPMIHYGQLVPYSPIQGSIPFSAPSRFNFDASPKSMYYGHATPTRLSVGSSNSNDYTEESIEIPMWSVGPLLGFKGANLEHIRRRTRTKIFVHKQENGDDAKVELKGQRDNVEKSIEIVQAIVNMCGERNELKSQRREQEEESRAFIEENEILIILLDKLSIYA